MADDGYDFFAPQPRPPPRQKNNLFEVVPDAFSPRTIELTGDHRRVKRGSGTSTPANEASDDVTTNMARDGAPPVPVEETMKQYVVKEVSAEMWEGTLTKVILGDDEFTFRPFLYIQHPDPEISRPGRGGIVQVLT